MNLTRYILARPHMHTGDILGFHRLGVVDRLISWWTRSPIDHVAMLIWIQQAGTSTLWLHNAEPSTGVSLIPASTYLERSDGDAFWYPMNVGKAEAINPNYQRDILTYALTTRGHHYGWQGIASFVIPWIRARRNEEYCSQLCAEDLRAAKLMTDTFESPAQVVSQPIYFMPEEL